MRAMSLRPLLLVPLLLCACASPGGRASATPAAAVAWQSPLLRDHPLTGRIWDVKAARFVDAEALGRALDGAQHVLLGERHDNADHHLLQARLVERVAQGGRRPALAFEMLETDQQPQVDAALARAPQDADALAEAVGWERSGWPAWALYRPVFVAGLARGLPVVAANLPRAQVRALGRQGAGALPPELVARLQLDVPLPEAEERSLREELVVSHCGLMPAEHMGPLVAVQVARDAQMAERMLAAPAGAVLVAGAGHVRSDRGVPHHLRRHAPEARVVSVAFLEVDAGATEPAAYADATRLLPYDYVWFTPAAEREDPCIRLREQMQGHRRPDGGA